MRVAVSGTHCSGKSTLIDEFLLSHPEFVHEPEPYTTLVEDYGEVFAAEPSADDFYRQLEFNVSRLRNYQPGQSVIFERCPVDFLAYLLALKNLRRSNSDTELIEKSLAKVIGTISFLDLIVFLPLNDEDPIETVDEEDPELRCEVDCRLEAVYNDGDLNLFSLYRPLVVEARGSTSQRMAIFDNALKMEQKLR